MNVTTNNYTFQDIFSNAGLNDSEEGKNISALQGIIQKNLKSSSTVKIFFQTLWECIVHFKTWDESKLTVILNNASPDDKVTIWEEIVKNLSNFKDELQKKLRDFVKTTMISTSLSSPTSIETSESQGISKNSKSEELKEAEELRTQMVNISHKLPFDADSQDANSQAELMLALKSPGCYKDIQNISQFVINIHNNRDEILGQKIDTAITYFNGNDKEQLNDLEKSLNDLVNDQSEGKEAFDKFYKIFKKTKIFTGVIERGNMPTIEIGNEKAEPGHDNNKSSNEKSSENTQKEQEKQEEQEERCERQTKELLYALIKKYDDIQQSENKKIEKADFLLNSIKNFHAFFFMLEQPQLKSIDEGINILGYKTQYPRYTEFYSIKASYEIDANGAMYSTILSYFDKKKCEEHFLELQNKESKVHTLPLNDKHLIEHFADALVFTTKTDLNNPEKKAEVSYCWKAGMTMGENIYIAAYPADPKNYEPPRQQPNSEQQKYNVDPNQLV